MFTTFAEFIRCLVEARFGFRYLWDVLVSTYYAMTENPHVQDAWEKIMSILSPIAIVVPYIIIVIGLIVAFFGKKMGGFLKFVGFLCVGFFLGMYFIGPLIPEGAMIPVWILGIVFAIVSAVLSKFLFTAIYCAVGLHSLYYLFYHGFFLAKDPTFSAGRAISALIIAAVILTVTLILFRFVQMLIFSALGAWIVCFGFQVGIIDLSAVPRLGAYSWILELSIFCVITICAFIFQIRTRKRY